jgi:predicted enzyme related to lactoylglutathione lyase
MNGDDATWWAVTIDCNDPRTRAEFWSTMLDTAIIEPGSDRPNWLRLQPLSATGPFINFQPVDGPNVGKVRLHLDVLVNDIDRVVERVVLLGGTDTGAREELSRGRIAVMRDPGGNEFCLLALPV